MNRYKDLEGYNNSELIISTTKQLDVLSKQLAIQSKSLDEIVEKLQGMITFTRFHGELYAESLQTSYFHLFNSNM